MARAISMHFANAFLYPFYGRSMVELRSKK
jgi:hypothetical protein